MAQVQTVFGQRYELHEVVGRGAMGVVYRARDRVLDRDVAIKVLAMDRSEDPTFIARFEREARAVARLNDPRIVMVYDSGREQETRFIVMEFVRGSSLAQIVRERGPLTPARAVEIATDVAGALGVAHRAGIIHRDVKPANVMLDERGAVKVLDFGIAKAASAVSLTHTATILGSAPYLAPEVIRGGPADEHSDIYSLGCVLYELLTGRPPFTAELPVAVLHQHDTADPQPPRALRAGIPAALDALVLGMLAKDPRSRPSSAGELEQALPASLGRASTPSWEAAAPGPQTSAARAMRRPRRGLSRAEWAALGVALALIAAGLVLAFTSGSSAPQRHETAKSTARHSSAAHVNRPAAHSSSTPAHTTPTKPATEPTKTPPASEGTPGPRTVAGAAGALTTLVTEGYEHGTLDQQAAQQILSGLHDTLNAYDSANTNDAVHHVSDLSSHVEQLSAHGDIQPAALPAVTSAVSDLRVTVEQAAPPAPNGLGTGPPAGPKSAGLPAGPKGPKEPPGHHPH